MTMVHQDSAAAAMARPPRAAVTYLAVAVLLAATLLAGCSAGDVVPETPTTPTPQTPTQPSQPADGGPVSLANLELGLESVARGFEQPLFTTHAGDGSGRLFVVEQAGTVRVVRNGEVSDGAFLDLRRQVTTGGERGLLGLAFAPDFSATGVFYVNYTNLDGDTVVAKLTADDPASDTPRMGDPQVLLRVEQPYGNHNGGCIVFEPGTTRLWIGMGDGGSGGDPQGNGQNPRALLGKMLVLDVSKAGAKPQIVQSGLRNPWRFSFDRETRDLWIGDVGQNAWEEIDFVALDEAEGVNWGWALWEGNHAFSGSNPTRDGMTFPIAEYPSSEGNSVTGGYVYRGTEFPALAGTYLYGDFVKGWIAGIRRTAPDGAKLSDIDQRVLLAPGTASVASFGEDESGELYVCDYSGVLWKVTATAK